MPLLRHSSLRQRPVQSSDESKDRSQFIARPTKKNGTIAGCFPTLEMKNTQQQFSIIFHSTNQPHKCVDTCRRILTAWKPEVETEIKRLHSQYIFRPSTSPYAAPMFPVRKKDGGLRLRIDYRALNSKTKPSPCTS